MTPSSSVSSSPIPAGFVGPMTRFSTGPGKHVTKASAPAVLSTSSSFASADMATAYTGLLNSEGLSFTQDQVQQLLQTLSPDQIGVLQYLQGHTDLNSPLSKAVTAGFFTHDIEAQVLQDPAYSTQLKADLTAFNRYSTTLTLTLNALGMSFTNAQVENLLQTLTPAETQRLHATLDVADIDNPLSMAMGVYAFTTAVEPQILQNPAYSDQLQAEVLSFNDKMQMDAATPNDVIWQRFNWPTTGWSDVAVSAVVPTPISASSNLNVSAPVASKASLSSTLALSPKYLKV